MKQVFYLISMILIAAVNIAYAEDCSKVYERVQDEKLHADLKVNGTLVKVIGLTGIAAMIMGRDKNLGPALTNTVFAGLGGVVVVNVWNAFRDQSMATEIRESLRLINIRTEHLDSANVREYLKTDQRLEGLHDLPLDFVVKKLEEGNQSLFCQINKNGELRLYDRKEIRRWIREEFTSISKKLKTELVTPLNSQGIR